MALSRDQKAAQVQELTEKMSRASSVMLAQYIGLNVADISELRNQLKTAGGELKVAKKTLLMIAAANAGMPKTLGENMDGPVSLIFSFDDPLSGAQIAFKFGKSHEQVALIGGLFDGKVLTQKEALELAQMPGREALLGMFMSMVRSPLFQFASMCNAPLSGFARALNQLAEKGGAIHEAAEEKGAEHAPTSQAEATEEVGAEPSDSPLPTPDSQS